MPAKRPLTRSSGSPQLEELTSSDSLGLPTYTVAALPTASSNSGGFTNCSDAVWSGGTGCQVRSNGTNWIDPDGRIASTTYPGLPILTAWETPALVSGYTYQFTLAANRYLLFLNQSTALEPGAGKDYTVSGNQITLVSALAQNAITNDGATLRGVYFTL